jgi:hypothetical protein
LSKSPAEKNSLLPCHPGESSSRGAGTLQTASGTPQSRCTDKCGLSTSCF